MENKGNMPSPKDNNNYPVTKLKNGQFCDLTDKEFKIAVLRKLKELQGNRKYDSLKSEKQYMNKRRNLAKRYKSLKRTKQKF